MYRWLYACALLALVPAALAKGPPDKLTIQGPGLSGTIEVTDPALLADLGFFALEDFDYNFRSGIEPPAVSEGYTLTRYLRNPNGTFQPWDRVIYYPDALHGRAVVFYEGLIGSGESEFDGKWYYAKPEGAAAMQRLLTTLGAAPPALLPTTSATSESYGRLALFGALLFISGLAQRHAVTSASLRRVRPRLDYRRTSRRRPYR